MYMKEVSEGTRDEPSNQDPTGDRQFLWGSGTPCLQAPEYLRPQTVETSDPTASAGTFSSQTPHTRLLTPPRLLRVRGSLVSEDVINN